MKVLSLTEPFATLIKNGIKTIGTEVGKQITKASCIFMPAPPKHQKSTETIKI